MFCGEGEARRALLRAIHETGVIDEMEPVLRVLAIVALSHQVRRRESHGDVNFVNGRKISIILFLNHGLQLAKHYLIMIFISKGVRGWKE